ncbi:MAG TPA: metal-dependent hydrolase, partial [Cryomorphaceae bacterium]|nr:metal-dependent hydrolase [Cryomorphaceae bacterium]
MKDSALNLQFIADLSLPVGDIPRAWYIDAPTFEPVRLGNWVGSVGEGGAVNFFNVGFNPHAHGTHTETAGHILPERHSVHRYFKDYFTKALVLTVAPSNGVVSLKDFKARWEIIGDSAVTSVIVRTESEPRSVATQAYSNTDWPYLDAAIGTFLREQGVDHLLIDQPSVDREEDGGALACHRAFWGPQPEKLLHRTISELLYIPAHVQDGYYLLNLQVAPFDNDAAPSRPL